MNPLLYHFTRKKNHFDTFFFGLTQIITSTSNEITSQIDLQYSNATKQFKDVPPQTIKEICNKMEEERYIIFEKIVDDLCQLLKDHVKKLGPKRQEKFESKVVANTDKGQGPLVGAVAKNELLQVPKHFRVVQQNQGIQRTQVNTKAWVKRQVDPFVSIRPPQIDTSKIPSAIQQNNMDMRSPMLQNFAKPQANLPPSFDSTLLQTAPIQSSTYQQPSVIYNIVPSAPMSHQNSQIAAQPQVETRNFAPSPFAQKVKIRQSLQNSPQKNGQLSPTSPQKRQKLSIMKKNQVCQSLDNYLIKQAKQMLQKSQSKSNCTNPYHSLRRSSVKINKFIEETPERSYQNGLGQSQNSKEIMNKKIQEKLASDSISSNSSKNISSGNQFVSPTQKWQIR